MIKVCFLNISTLLLENKSSRCIIPIMDEIDIDMIEVLKSFSIHKVTLYEDTRNSLTNLDIDLIIAVLKTNGIDASLVRMTRSNLEIKNYIINKNIKSNEILIIDTYPIFYKHESLISSLILKPKVDRSLFKKELKKEIEDKT